MAANNKQRLTLFVNPELAKQAKAQAIIDDLTLTTLVEKSLIAYLPKVTIIRKVVRN
ncbi:MAG: hypothetical protein AAB550_02890 [Patescibacteria group bacterium]